MDTLIDKILEDNYRYKLFVYQILLFYEEAFIEEDILTKTLEISEFKLSQHLKELVGDLNEIRAKSELKIKSDHVYQGKYFSIEDYQNLRRYYFEASLEVNLLVQVGIFQHYTLLDFAKVRFISKSTVYSVVKKLNEYLDNWDIILKNNQLQGEESAVRIFCFQFFLYFYGSNQPAIFHKKELAVGNVINDLQLIFLRNFSINQFSQLRLFLSIQYIRVTQGNLINKISFGISMEENVARRVKQWYREKNIRLSQNKFEDETEYLISFMVLNGFIENKTIIKIQETDNFEVFRSIVRKEIPQLQMELTGSIGDAIKLLCFKWEYFTFSFASFVSKDQIIYFKQSFPKIHELVYKTIEALDKNRKRKLRDFEKAHIYYDFIFCLLQFKKVREMENTIHVYVDFSGGLNYNQFIKLNILSFDYLNIEIDSKLTSQTDIYISDFYSSKVSCDQIIWKNPPVSYDWKLFANRIIELKGDKR